MMSDVYSVNFKSTLRHWMETINDYPKPFNFVFVPLTDFLENMADFMIDDDCKAQCFNEAILAKRSTIEQAGQAQADQGMVLEVDLELALTIPEVFQFKSFKNIVETFY